MARFTEKAITLSETYGADASGWKRSNPSQTELLRQYTGTVFAAAKRITDKITSTDLRLYSTRKSGTKAIAPWDRKAKRIESTRRKYMVAGDDVAEVTSHDALDLLRRPNPLMTGRQFLAYNQLYLDIAGICYWRVMTSENGTHPTELYILPPHCVRVQRDSSGNVTRYEFGNESLAPDDVLCQTTENLLMPYGNEPGVSSVGSVFDTLGLQQRITATLTAIMDNEGRPSGILAPKGEYGAIGEDEAERWRRRYRQFLRSGAGDVMVVDADATFTPLNYKPTDLAAIEISKRIEEMVAVAFQIPVMILRGTEGGSRAAYQTALQEWADGGLSSRLRDLEDFLNFVYLPRFDESESLFFCFDDPSPDLAELNQQIVTGYVNAGLWTPNEGRAYLGYEPVDGGDELRWSGLATGQDAAAEPAAPTDQEPLETEQQITTLPESTLNGAQIQAATAIVQQVAQGQLPRDSGLGQLQILLNLSADQAGQIMGSVGVTFFAPQAEPEESNEPATEGDTGKAARLIVPDVDGRQWLSSIAEPEIKAARKPPSGKELEPILIRHFRKWETAARRTIEKAQSDILTKGLPAQFVPLKEWEKDLADDCQPVVEIFFEEEGHKLLQRVGASPDVFNVFNHRVKQRAASAALELAQSTLETTSKDINAALDETRAALAEGLEAGESVATMTRRLKEIFDNAETYRAKRIAQTEASRAHHEGLRDAAKESGVVKGFEWLTSSDPCPLCQELNGNRIGINGDLPPLHPNCECTVLEILDQGE